MAGGGGRVAVRVVVLQTQLYVLCPCTRAAKSFSLPRRGRAWSIPRPYSPFSEGGRGNSRAREEIGCRFLQGIVQGAQEVLGIFLGDFDNVGIEGYIIG